jgi:hypothetical protein
MVLLHRVWQTALRAGLLCLGCVAAHADDLQALRDQLPGKLINDPTSIAWDVFGGGATSVAIRGTDVPGGGALQVTIPAKGATPYDAGMAIPLKTGFARGTAYVVSFYARTVSAATPDGNGVIAVRFQQNAAPYPGFGDTALAIGPHWQLYEVTGTADRDVPSGQAVISLQLASAKQVLQIGQTVVQEGATSLHKPAVVAKPAACKVPTPVLPANLADKGTVLTDIDALNWDVSGAGESHERIQACGVPGDTAYRFTVAAAGAHPYDVVATVTIGAPIKRGESFMIGLVGRTLKSAAADGKGVVTLRVQRNTPDYPGFGDTTLAYGPAWQLQRFMVEADQDIPPGTAALVLQLAGAGQTLDLGRAYVIRTPAGKP